MKRYALYDVATGTKRRPNMQMVQAPDGGWVRYEDVEAQRRRDFEAGMRCNLTLVAGGAWKYMFNSELFDTADGACAAYLATPQGAEDE